MSGSARVLLAGGPETGKSNYIYRLWMDIDKSKGLLEKDGFPDQLDYLNAGVQSLLGGQFAPRTPLYTFNTIEIPFQLAGSDTRGKLIVPDISGEDSDRSYKDREWNLEWEGCIAECEGCLVFLREHMLQDSLSWMDVSRIMGVVSEHGKESDGSIPTPTQVISVEWLQFLREALDEVRGHSFIPRIAIIVAAWDEIGEEVQEMGPDGFVEQFTPLLYSFVDTNRDRFETMIFGTSVMGGDPDQDPEFKEKYLNSNPYDFGYVVYTSDGDLKQFNDITIPVSWILGAAIE
jgi:hypothetical protein